MALSYTNPFTPALYPFYIEMFGGLRLRRINGPSLELPPQQTSLLLACLALQMPGKRTREELICLLWPDDDVEEAQHNLRQCLYKLRQQLDTPPLSAEGILVANRTQVSLDPAAVSTDVAEFEAALKGAKQATEAGEKIAWLRGAVEKYQGELLPGFYSNHILSERERLAEAHRRALSSLIRACEQTGATGEAIDYARRLVALDPLLEEARADLIRLYMKSGQPGSARRQFAELERALREELDMAPSDETRRLLTALTSPPSPGEIPTVAPVGTSYREPVSLSTELSSPPSSLPPQESHAPPASAPARLAEREEAHGRMPRLPSVGKRAAALVMLLVIAWMGITAIWSVRRGNRSAAKPGAPVADVSLHQVWSQAYQANRAEGEKENSEGHVVVADEQGVYVAGTVETETQDCDILVVRYSPDGEELWRSRYSSPEGDCDRAYAMVLEGRGVFVAGETYVPKEKDPTGQGGWQLALLRYEEDGTRSVEQRFPRPTENSGAHNIRLARDGEGGVYLAGTQIVNGKQSILALRYDRQGKLLWEAICLPKETLETRLAQIVSPANAKDNNLYLCGVARLKPTARGEEEDGLAAQITPEGDVGWTRLISGPVPGKDNARCLALNPRAEHLVVGMNYYTGDPALGGSGNVVGLAHAALRTGELKLSRPHRLSGPTSSVTALHNGLLVGQVVNPDGKQEILTVYYAADGTFYHEERTLGPEQRSAGGGAIAWLQGHYLVAGATANVLGNNDIQSQDGLLLDYGGDGHLRRTHLYAEPPQASQHFNALWADPLPGGQRLYAVGQSRQHSKIKPYPLEARLFLVCYEMK